MPIRLPIDQPPFESPEFTPDRYAVERLGHSGARWMVVMALGLMMLGVAFSL